MTKKRIRQMNAALLRRLSLRPAAEYLAGREKTAAQLVGEGYFQRFAPLMDRRLCCARVLDLCREDLERLDGPEPEEGWLPYCYDFARRLLFPEKDARPAHGAGAVFFLSVLQVLLDAERELLDYDPAWDFVPPGPEELEDCPAALQFGQMMRLWRREFVYEMMRLGLEVTPYRTLEHIVGVHHVAVTAGRALRRGGVELDLALVSGSAIGHDIGKFGCRPGERVPYLHYYYTDQWFRRRKLTDIGHVAANHSVWDLELDYLSVESLLLIYADFRVKQTRDDHGREVTKIFSLAEAFNVILSKLDGVDREKRRRYELVYARLYDFEQFMLARGVDVTLLGRDTPPRPEKHTALMTDQEALDALTLQCVGHNIGLMHRLTGQRSFASLLEQARGETNWRRLRAYLGVFESYSLYLHIPQKVQTLAFLYELLMHREGDIRRQAAALLGEIIAGFHAGYAKERPADSRPDAGVPTDLDQWKLYLQRIIYPDHKLMPQHQRWIRYTLKFAVDSLLQRCPGREERFLAPFFAYYRHPQQLEDEVAFQLLDTAAALPPAALTRPRQELLLRFAEGVCDREDVTVRAAAVLLVVVLCGVVEGFAQGTGGKGAAFLPMAGALSITLASAGSLDSLMGLGSRTIGELADFSQALLPTLAAATAASGAVTTATVQQVSTVFFVDLLLRLIRQLLLPLVYFYVAAAAADAMLPGRRLAGISRAIRKGTVWLLTGALALFTLYLTVSGAAAGSADTVTARLARSAVGVLPVVGSILADAADTVLAGAGAVKNTVGAAGLLAVLAVCLLPLMRLGVQYLVYKAAAFLAGILGAEQLTGLIDALGGAFGLIFGMTGACGLLLLISISSALGVVTG